MATPPRDPKTGRFLTKGQISFNKAIGTIMQKMNVGRKKAIKLFFEKRAKER